MTIATTIRRLPRVLRRQRLIRFLLRVSPSSPIQVITLKDGTRFYGDLTQPVPRNTLIEGHIDPQFIELARAFLSGAPGDRVMFDVGANYGIYAFALCGIFPDVRAHLFDANPKLCELLRKSAAFYPGVDIRVTNACIFERSGGHSMLKVDAANDGGSHISDTGDFEVPNMSLGDYARQEGIKEIAFAKMDIEGFELNALRGLLSPDRDGILKALVVEVLTSHLARAGSTPWDLFELLASRGFRLYHFRPHDFQSSKYNSFRVDESKRRSWTVNGQRISLALLDAELAQRENWTFNTDLLAVHDSVEMHEA